MAARTLSLALLAAAALLPSMRRGLRNPGPLRPCQPEGRGAPPRGWLGCAGDRGPPRGLTPAERLAIGLPIDPNTAGEAELALVPGLTRRLARAIVSHRELHGPFADLEALRSVKGIGPRRLEQARARLAVGPGARATPSGG
jgi:competence protein ComEA